MDWLILNKSICPNLKDRIKILFCRELNLTIGVKPDSFGGVDLGKVQLISIHKKENKITPFIPTSTEKELKITAEYYNQYKGEKKHGTTT